MPSYALLGATGQTGSEILSILSRTPGATVHAFVRSRKKLIEMVPSVGSQPNVKIFEGDISNVESLEKCITGVSAVFSCVATNENVPGCSIALDTAHSIIAALCAMRSKDPSAPIPRIIVLSAMPVNDKLAESMPAFVRRMLFWGYGYVYEDLKKAEKYYRLHSSWMSATFIQPGGLTVDKPKGHELSTEKADEWLSYADLAAGMIEVADSDGKYDWMGVSVLGKEKTKFNSKAPSMLLRGMLWSMMPWLYRLLH